MTKLDYDSDNQGFHHRIDDVLGWAYPRARRTAARQTGLPPSTFPAECEWVFIRLMNEDSWV